MPVATEPARMCAGAPRRGAGNSPACVRACRDAARGTHPHVCGRAATRRGEPARMFARGMTHGGATLDSLLIHGGTLVCMDAARTVKRGDLLVAGERILAIGDAVPAAEAALPGGRAKSRYDASGALVLPGFVHAHLHLCQTLFRGLAEQSDLLRWLREAIWPLEAAHTDASLTASVQLGACELIAGGVTCVNDMGTVHHADALGRALEGTGLRAVFGPALMGQGE